MKKIGVVGAGAMGGGIAEVAATAGHSVVIFDVHPEGLTRFKTKLEEGLQKRVEKGKLSAEQALAISQRIAPAPHLDALKDSDLIIEAAVENITIKKELFKQLESLVSDDCILASNTSSLSIASIGSACQNPARVLGIHFFNPATLMELVEIIPGVATHASVVDDARACIDSWGKKTVLAKDTPGFIVNRIARPFYGEAIRIYEEGIADFKTIDEAMKWCGGFRMGPFELMDFIGNDINFAVTESVFQAFWNDPRYKPSFTQKRLVEAGRLGRKSGQGYYTYPYDFSNATPNPTELHQSIFKRILAMLMNEAADAVFWQIATPEDVDLAMTKGVNYPKGLLKWADEWGIEQVWSILNQLYDEYAEDRYRPSPLWRKMIKNKQTFYHG